MAVWYLMRGSGVVSLLLLSGAVVLGIATTGSARLGWLPRFATLALHRSLALLATAFVAVHVVAAVIDPYAAVRLVDVVVPFTAESQPLWVGLGAIAVDLLAALIVTGLLRARIGQRAFRLVHWAAYVAWPVALVHSVGIGTDAGTPWMWAVAVGSVGAVAAALAWRALSGRDAEPARPARIAPRPQMIASRGRP